MVLWWCAQQDGGLRLWAGAVLVVYDCMQCCDTMADAHGGVWWCTVMYAALAGWAAGEAWCGGVWIDGLCVQRVQWCAGECVIGVPKCCSKNTTPTTVQLPLTKPCGQCTHTVIRARGVVIPLKSTHVTEFQ